MNLLSQVLVAGAKWNWTESLTEYPADEYYLKIDLKRQADATKTLTASADGNDFEFSVAAVTTAAYTAGYYAFHAYVVEIADATNIITVAVDVIEVKKDLSSVADGQTFALSMVEKIRAQLLLCAAETFSSISVDDKNVVLKDETRLRQDLNYWESKAGLVKGGMKRRLTKFVNN